MHRVYRIDSFPLKENGKCFFKTRKRLRGWKGSVEIGRHRKRLSKQRRENGSIAGTQCFFPIHFVFFRFREVWLPKAYRVLWCSSPVSVCVKIRFGMWLFKEEYHVFKKTDPVNSKDWNGNRKWIAISAFGEWNVTFQISRQLVLQKEVSMFFLKRQCDLEEAPRM